LQAEGLGFESQWGKKFYKLFWPLVKYSSTLRELRGQESLKTEGVVEVSGVQRTGWDVVLSLPSGPCGVMAVCLPL